MSLECKEIKECFVLLLKNENSAFDMSKHIILLTFDDNYVNQTINLILSISKYHKNEVSYICMCPQLRQESINVLLSQDVGIQVRCYDFLSIIDPGDWPACAMFRLFAPWLLEDCIRKVLYMDSDIICTASIKNLLIMETPYIAMCPELAANAIQYAVSEHLPVQIYCNSGVTVLNLAALRTDYTFTAILSALENMRPILSFPDQDFLNYYFQGKIEILNGMKYNCIPHEIKGSKYYRFAINNCSLMHFPSSKPWSYKGELFLIRLYLKYSEFPPMRAVCRRALWKSHFHAIVRLNRPIQRWYYGVFVPWRKGRGK